MTLTYVLTNHKGGVGKSTTATTIALGISGFLRELNVKKHRVLLIDTDSQAHATLVTTGRNNFSENDSLYAVLMSDRDAAVETLIDCITVSKWDKNLHVLPASTLLEAAERELQGTSGAPYRLADPLSKIASRYAAVVIDTRPSFSLLTEMALVASTDVIVPVEPRYPETVGLLSVLAKINDIREGWRIQNLRINGILVTKLDRRVKGHHRMLADLQKHPTLGKLLLGVIPMNEAVSYAHEEHRSIFAYDHKSAASKAYARLIGRLVRGMERPR